MFRDWRAFGEELGAALATPNSLQAVRDLIRQVLVAGPSESLGEDELVRRVSERLAVVDGDAARLIALATDVTQLLKEASSEDAVELLLEVVAERERFLGILAKHMDGTISRTGLLSFIAKQRWPGIVRRRAEEVTAANPDGLLGALRRRDVTQLEALLAD